MSVRDPRFRVIQQRLKSLGFYALPIDDEFGDGMADALGRALATLEVRPSATPPALVDLSRLPGSYSWLAAEPYLPRHLVIALNMIGVVETPGPGNTAEIMRWRDELRAAGVDVTGYTGDAVPWCGLFMAAVMQRAARPVADKPLWALSWATWGEPGGQPELGDVLTFKRDGGGHVALYIAEDQQGYYHILGGNQGDRVNIMRIAKTRLHSCRQVPYRNKPATVRPVVVSPSGVVFHNQG